MGQPSRQPEASPYGQEHPPWSVMDTAPLRAWQRCPDGQEQGGVSTELAQEPWRLALPLGVGTPPSSRPPLPTWSPPTTDVSDGYISVFFKKNLLTYERE